MTRRLTPERRAELAALRIVLEAARIVSEWRWAAFDLTDYQRQRYAALRDAIAEADKAKEGT